jgi:hypothetical protein
VVNSELTAVSNERVALIFNSEEEAKQETIM